MESLAPPASSNVTDPAKTPAQPAPGAGEIRPVDWIFAALALAVTLVLRTLYIHALPWHSDEPQHLHVVWGWATGRLPYRDVFDNHSPLFGFLMSFIFRLFGERNDIVEVMRWVMLPLLGVSLWSLYKLGEAAFSPRAGLWAAIVGGFFAPWFLKMAEFRTDVLWTTLWLLTLVILCSGRLTTRRLFVAGLVLGAAFSVSMKSTLMLLTMLAAGGVTWVVMRITRRSATSSAGWPDQLGKVAAALGGLLLIPAAFVLFFVSQGIGQKMYYCVIQHNLTPGAHHLGAIVHGFLHWQGLFIPATIALAWVLASYGGADRGQIARRIFIVCVTGLFCPILEGVWTNVTPQDYTPLWPLIGGGLAAAILSAGDWLQRQPNCASFSSHVRVMTAVALAAVSALEVGWIILSISPSNALSNKNVSDNLGKIEAIKEARELTNPGEFIIDSKGENIYRPRPYWYVLETLTRKRLYSGELEDDLPSCLVKTRTAVAIPSKARMMDDSLSFFQANYISVGLLDVAGQILPRNPAGSWDFEIVVPQRYTLVTKAGPAPTGLLDGQPFDGPRQLEAGHHTFQRTAGTSQVAVIWAQAADRGFSPFHLPASLIAIYNLQARGQKN